MQGGVYTVSKGLGGRMKIGKDGCKPQPNALLIELNT